MFDAFGQRLQGVTLIPTEGGIFDVVVNEELVFSKKKLGRHAEPGEVVSLVRSYIPAEEILKTESQRA